MKEKQFFLKIIILKKQAVKIADNETKFLNT